MLQSMPNHLCSFRVSVAGGHWSLNERFIVPVALVILCWKYSSILINTGYTGHTGILGILEIPSILDILVILVILVSGVD